MENPHVLVVLGAAVWRNERPSPALEGRARCASRLYLDAAAGGRAPKILACGGLGGHPPSEAEMIRRLCVAEGVPHEDVVLEDGSRSTYENARLGAVILQRMGARSLTVITDAYHQPRARMCFRAHGYAAEGRSPPARGPLWRRAYGYLRELAALPWYVVKLALRRRREPR